MDPPDPLDPYAEAEEPPAPYPTGAGQFPPTGPNSLASIGQRFLARLVDGVVLLGPLLALTLPYIEGGNTPSLDQPLWAQFLGMLAIPVLYEALLIAWRGQTVGKATLGIRVARLVDGKTPTIGPSTVRVLLPVAVGNLPIIGILSLVIYLMAWASPLRQGWHDRAAGTVVVRTR